MSMVPNTFPDKEGIDLYATMMPAKEVGGDLYDYLLEDSMLYFCIGDVSGKGVPASLFMAQVTRLFRTLAAQSMMPAEIATRMNAALAEDNEQGMFVTMFIGLADLTTGHLDFCNCGHNPPVIGNKEPDTAQHSSQSAFHFHHVLSNAPIGLWPGLEFEGEHIDNIKNKPILLYTDGLNEAEDHRQQQFGDDRLLSLISTTAFDNARHAVETLKAAVEQHRNGADPNDDLTILGLLIS
jgi:serine phosphatase RsbU (regulator of sigma subunit)